MSNAKWKPLPGFPVYEINRSGWVRNARGYMLANGQGAMLSTNGKTVSLGRKRLLELAAEAFALETPREIVPLTIQELPVPVKVAEPKPEVQAITKEHEPYAHPHVTRERLRQWIDPEHQLPLRDPWADGSIEVESTWALQGVM
jgi:hypothetical protein